MKPKNKVKTGDRIRITDSTSPLAGGVVYTVQGTRNGLPVVFDCWQAVAVRSFEKVP